MKRKTPTTSELALFNIQIFLRNSATKLTKYFPFSDIFTSWPFHHKNRNIVAFRETVLDVAVETNTKFIIFDFEEDEYFIYLVIKIKTIKNSQDFLEKLNNHYEKGNFFIQEIEEDPAIKILKIRKDYFLDTFPNQA